MAVIPTAVPAQQPDLPPSSVLPLHGWLPARPTGPAVTTTIKTSDPTSSTAPTQILQNDMTRPVGDFGDIDFSAEFNQPDFSSIESSPLQSGYFGQSYEQSQRCKFSESPLDHIICSQNIHHSSTSSDVITNNSETVGYGLNLNWEHVPPLDSTLNLDSNIDFIQPAAAAPSTVSTSGVELRQPVGNSPLTAIVSGKYTDTKDPSDNDFLQSQSPLLQQALEWKPAQETSVQFGLRERAYQNFQAPTTQKTQGLFAHLSNHLLPDLTWNSDLEYLRSREDRALLETPEGGSPNSLAGSVTAPLQAITPFEQESMWLKMGPAFQLDQDLSAHLEFSNQWNRSFGPAGTSGSEQRISFSLKGTF